MPTITSGAEVFRQIDLGGNLQLNKHGGLETQSGIQHFLQNIGDAFRGLTEGGRLTMSLRYAAIENAMAQLVALDMFPNLAQQPLGQGGIPQIGNAQREEGKFQIHLYRAMNNAQVSSAERPLYRSMISQMMTSYAQQALRHGEPLSLDRKDQIAEVLIGKLLNNCDMPLRMKLDDNHVIEQNDTVKKMMTEGIKNDFLRQLSMKGEEVEGGYHRSYFLDTARGSVESINGAPPRDQVINPQSAAAKSSIEQEYKGFREQLDEILPDNPVIRRFISAAASQAGLMGELAIDLVSNKANILGAGRPTMDELFAARIVPDTAKHKIKISVDTNNILSIHLDLDDVYRIYDMDHIIDPINCGFPQYFSATDICISYGKHSMDMSVDLNQDMTDKKIPDFTIDSIRIDYQIDK